MYQSKRQETPHHTTYTLTHTLSLSSFFLFGCVVRMCLCVCVLWIVFQNLPCMVLNDLLHGTCEQSISIPCTTMRSYAYLYIYVYSFITYMYMYVLCVCTLCVLCHTWSDMWIDEFPLPMFDCMYWWSSCSCCSGCADDTTQLTYAASECMCVLLPLMTIATWHEVREESERTQATGTYAWHDMRNRVHGKMDMWRWLVTCAADSTTSHVAVQQ